MKTTITTIFVRSYSYKRYLGGRLNTITTSTLLVITFSSQTQIVHALYTIPGMEASKPFF